MNDSFIGWIFIIQCLMFLLFFQGMSMPIAHVEESWQMAEFYSNKVFLTPARILLICPCKNKTFFLALSGNSVRQFTNVDNGLNYFLFLPNQAHSKDTRAHCCFIFPHNLIKKCEKIAQEVRENSNLWEFLATRNCLFHFGGF